MPRRPGAGYHLVVAYGKQQVDRWPLPTDRPFLLGRADGAPALLTDVDLWPDRRVSRKHARLWQVDGSWWIEDVESKYGTLVDGQPIEPGRPAPLRAWSEIVLGTTTLFLAPPDWHRLTSQDLVVDLAVVGAVNLSLAHAGLPIVRRLVVRSRSETVRPPARLRIAVESCIDPVTVRLPAVEPASSVAPSLPRPSVRHDVLESQPERSRRRLTVTLDGESMRGEPIDCWSLPYNEWSTLPEHRRALATFALPNHPAVAGLCTELMATLGADVAARETLAALFNLLAERWHLSYRHEPPHWGTHSQKIRLPHRVLVDDATRHGEGTCIDLALLVAACLENLELQPLIAVVDLGTVWHALVGCWDPFRAPADALYGDVNQLLDGAIWLDATCLTRDAQLRRPFEDACAQADRYLRMNPLLFGLDIAVARQDGITPLPVSGTPGWSAAVDQAIRSARAQTTAAGGMLCSAVLLAGLLASGDALTRRIVAECTGGDADAALKTIVTSLPPAKPGLESTPGYRQVLDLARSRAKDAEALVVLPNHLLGALISVQSVSLAQVLEKLGTDQECLARLWRLYGGGGPDTGGLADTSWF